MNLEIPAALLKEDEDSTNQRILDSARSLYIEYGLRRTTMEDVSKRAGMGRATLYRRFSEKDQLFKAVIFRDLNAAWCTSKRPSMTWARRWMRYWNRLCCSAA